MAEGNETKTSLLILTIVIGITILILGIDSNARYKADLPPFPTLYNKPTDTVEANIANFNDLEKAIDKKASFLYDKIATKFLVPIFEALMGIILGVKFVLPMIKAFSNYLSARADFWRSKSASSTKT